MFRAFSHEIPKVVTRDTHVVYVDGSWDIFHAGHVSVLRQAVLLGDFVLVGVHDDAEVRRSWGSQFPILGLQERALSAMGCRHVDDVLIGAPVEITREMLSALKIKTVLCFSEGADGAPRMNATSPADDPRYDVPKKLGILHEYRRSEH